MHWPRSVGGGSRRCNHETHEADADQPNRKFAISNMQHRQAVRISKEMAHCLRHKPPAGVCGLNPAQLRRNGLCNLFPRFAAAAVGGAVALPAAAAPAAAAAAAASPGAATTLPLLSHAELVLHQRVIPQRWTQRALCRCRCCCGSCGALESAKPRSAPSWQPTPKAATSWTTAPAHPEYGLYRGTACSWRSLSCGRSAVRTRSRWRCM